MAAPGGAGGAGSAGRQELLATVSKQGEQLRRYETRLRDVVTAYKGLVKQKEALETSLNAINKSKGRSAEDDSVTALTLSLSTLTAEKSRIEEAFQSDKKLTRENYERSLQELREEIKSMTQQHQTEVNNLNARIAFEMQEREKDRADHSAMLKELHTKLNSERKSKEKLEDKFVVSTENLALSTDMGKRVRDLSSELEAAQRKLQRAEARTAETPQMLVRLQDKMSLLQQSHALALREEQIKVKRAEETARKICATQEERVTLLEAKLAELSHTVGEYDLRRRKDQQLIQHLRDSLNMQILEQNSADRHTAEDFKSSETDNEKLADTEYLQNLIDKIHILKQELIAENNKLGSPIDVTSIFSINMTSDNIHSQCREEFDALKAEFDSCKRQLSQNNSPSSSSKNSKSETESLISHIEVLQDKVDSLTAQLQEERRDKEDRLRNAEECLIREQNYHKDVASDLRSRILNLEKQLQTQRERYSVLLEETDNYIRSTNNRSRKVSTADSDYRDSQNGLQEVTGPPHMLHYAHELARKDLDISQLRKDKHMLEGQLRDSQRDATIEKERLKEVLKNLKDEIDRLRRIQSREGANLEYLKNVVWSYLVSSDYAGRKHMLNAIAAVLHFTDAEKNSVLALI